MHSQILIQYDRNEAWESGLFTRPRKVVKHTEVSETQHLCNSRTALKDLGFIVVDQLQMSCDVAVKALSSENIGCKFSQSDIFSQSQ